MSTCGFLSLENASLGMDESVNGMKLGGPYRQRMISIGVLKSEFRRHTHVTFPSPSPKDVDEPSMALRTVAWN